MCGKCLALGKTVQNERCRKTEKGKKIVRGERTHTHMRYMQDKKKKKPRDEEKEQGGHRRDDVGEVQYESERETAE